MSDQGWENVERSLDGADPESIVIMLDLSRFGELVARVADTLCNLRGIEEFDVHSQEARSVALDAWRYVCHMIDRAEFTKSVEKDLAALQEPQPEHLPEFGGAAKPIGWNPPA